MERPLILNPKVYSQINNEEVSCTLYSPNTIARYSCVNDSYNCIDLIAGFQICYLLDIDNFRAGIQMRFAGVELASLEVSPEEAISYEVNVGLYSIDANITLTQTSEKICLHAKGTVSFLFGTWRDEFDFDIICF